MQQHLYQVHCNVIYESSLRSHLFLRLFLLGTWGFGFFGGCWVWVFFFFVIKSTSSSLRKNPLIYCALVSGTKDFRGKKKPFRFLGIASRYTSASLCGQKACHGTPPALAWHWEDPKQFGPQALCQRVLFSQAGSQSIMREISVLLCFYTTWCLLRS